jgi:hypothetical protein
MIKRGLDFDSHIKNDHHIWKYSNYLAYLVNKDVNEMTGLEGMVWENYINKKTDWIPWADDSDDEDESEDEKEEEPTKKKETSTGMNYNSFCKKLEGIIQKKFGQLDLKITKLSEQVEKLAEEDEEGDESEGKDKPKGKNKTEDKENPTN